MFAYIYICMSDFLAFDDSKICKPNFVAAFINCKDK